MPKLPSLPNSNPRGWTPVEFLGVTWRVAISPVGVTSVASSTMSSILPYRFFFIPLALVEIQPPIVDNSTLSGSCPDVYPRSPSALSIALPEIPASTQA